MGGLDLHVASLYCLRGFLISITFPSLDIEQSYSAAGLNLHIFPMHCLSGILTSITFVCWLGCLGIQQVVGISICLAAKDNGWYAIYSSIVYILSGDTITVIIYHYIVD